MEPALPTSTPIEEIVPTDIPEEPTIAPTDIPEEPTIAPTEQVLEVPEVLAGDVLFEDDFSDVNSGWDQLTDDTGSMTDYENDIYHIISNKVNWDYWANPNDLTVETDVIVDVDVIRNGGPENTGAGIICSYDMSTHSDFIVLLLGYDNRAEIYEYRDREITNLVEARNLSNVNPYSNHLTATCANGTYSLAVNGVVVAVATVPDYRVGNVGLLASTFNDAIGGDFFFDNFVVRTVQD